MGPKEREIKRRLRVLEHAEKIGNVRMTCRYFGLSRSTFYRWKTRVRALKIYPRHNQANACDFVNYFIEKFPFRIYTIRTDRGHEFQAKFHWHVEDKGIRHVYIKPPSPQLNGKVERSHRSDQEEFYQLMNYVDDRDLNEKLIEWENFYNFHRPHGAFAGRTPYEILRERLQ